jgi:hypothetical protein
MFDGLVRAIAAADPALPVMRILIGMLITGPQ